MAINKLGLKMFHPDEIELTDATGNPSNIMQNLKSSVSVEALLVLDNESEKYGQIAFSCLSAQAYIPESSFSGTFKQEILKLYKSIENSKGPFDNSLVIRIFEESTKKEFEVLKGLLERGSLFKGNSGKIVDALLYLANSKKPFENTNNFL